MVVPKRRVWRKIHLGIDEETLEVRAVEITGSHIGDAPVLPDLLDQIPQDQEICSALAIETFAPDMASFRRGRDFAAWLGLVPKQHSTGGKARLGKTSKMGQRDIRTLLVSGAMAVLQAVERFDTPNNGWLKRLLTRKPRMVAAIALANKMARGLWAMMTKQEDYRNPVAAMV